MFASSEPYETIPSKNIILEVQQQAKAGLGTLLSDASSLTTPVGLATRDNEDLCRVGLDGRDVLWIPQHAKEMQKGLVVCAHMKSAGRWGVVVSLPRLQIYCLFYMQVHVTEFVNQYLRCMDSKVGKKVHDNWKRRCTG